MNEKVLTDDEKGALLEGVESGDVEVQSSDGPKYASVKPFEIGSRSRIVSDSFPRLQLLNQQCAYRLTSYAEILLQTEVTIEATDTSLWTYNEFCEQNSGPLVASVFSANPLEGDGLVVLETGLVRQLVESFFGGTGNKPSQIDSENFTPGELSVSKLYMNAVLRTIKEVWESVIEVEPQAGKIELNVDLVNVAGESDLVIVSEFEASFPDHQAAFRILLPLVMIERVLPIFKGQKAERDSIQDSQWEKSIRAGLANAVVNVTSDVGHAKLTIGDLINLTTGDVIQIDSPTAAIVSAQRTPILHGRFGVHAGHNAIEATEWIASESAI